MEHMTQAQLPIDRLLAGRSDRAVERAGGCSRRSLRRLRSGGELRRDTVKRLSRALRLPVQVVAIAVAATIARVRGDAEAA